MIYKEGYEKQTGRHFQLELRTPSEYVGAELTPQQFRSQEASDYLFSYVFAKADIRELDDFLHFREMQEWGIRLVHRCTNGSEISADWVSDEEIDHFFHFCNAYAYYTQNRNIPFYEFTPEELQHGTRVVITEGPCSGEHAIISDDQSGVAAGMVRVNVVLRDTIGVPTDVQSEYLRVSRPEKYRHSKYEFYDEFFDYFSTSAPYERYKACTPSIDDIARALRMKALTDDIDAQRNHSLRDSKRLRYVRLSARIVALRILEHTQEASSLMPEWQNLHAQQKHPEGDTAILTLLGNDITQQN